MRIATALICSVLLAIALAVACSFMPAQRVSDGDGHEYAAHWVVVQFIETDPSHPAAEESWTRAAAMVSGHLSSSEDGTSLRRVVFAAPKDYEGLIQVCEDLKMMDCVFDALPDPVIESADGSEVFRFEHYKQTAAAPAAPAQ